MTPGIVEAAKSHEKDDRAGRFAAFAPPPKVRTVVDCADAEETWSTVGVSTNIIDASWHAVVDSIGYGLLRSG